MSVPDSRCVRITRRYNPTAHPLARHQSIVYHVVSTHPQGQFPAPRAVAVEVLPAFTVPQVHESPHEHDEPVDGWMDGDGGRTANTVGMTREGNQR